MSVQIERISNHQLDLGEGPHWDIKTKKLYFVDIQTSTVHQYDPESKKHTWATVGNKEVSIIIPIENEVNKFIITHGCDLATITWDGVSETVSNLSVLVTVDDPYPDRRINDGKCSPSGVLLAGTMWRDINEIAPSDIPTNGHLYTFKGDTVKKLIKNVGISNGLAWSRDEKTLYYIDSVLLRVDAFDYDKDNIILSNRKTIFDFKAHDIKGFPDGMTIDTDGNLWVAVFGGSQVLKINPSTGDLIDKIQIPALYVTSVAFGGPNLEDLYVTTASNVSKIYCVKNEPDAGVVFKVTGTGSRGFPGSNVKL